IESPRHVHGRVCVTKDSRHPKVGTPPGVLDAGGSELTQRLRRIADAINPRAEAQVANRLDEEFLQLMGPLAIAPVADPDQIQRLVGVGVLGTEHANVRGLVPNPRTRRPTPLEIDPPENIAKSQNAGIPREVVRLQLLRSTHRAVVS